METQEILKALRKSDPNRKCIIRMVVSYILYEMGYKTSHIANALMVDRTSSYYAVRSIEKLMSVKDAFVCGLYANLKQHEYRLEPYFDKKFALYDIGTKLIIDNIKL